MSAQTDRIEKKILLRAPADRVWRALTDHREFGAWFGFRSDTPFTPGAVVRGRIAPTEADPEVARLQKQFEGTPFEITIEKMERERLFSFRWHPNAVDANVDYTAEPTTLVELTLDKAPGGVMLTVVESGFDRIPLARRAAAFTANDGGWTLVVKLVEAWVGRAA